MLLHRHRGTFNYYIISVGGRCVPTKPLWGLGCHLRRLRESPNLTQVVSQINPLWRRPCKGLVSTQLAINFSFLWNNDFCRFYTPIFTQIQVAAIKKSTPRQPEWKNLLKSHLRFSLSHTLSRFFNYWCAVFQNLKNQKSSLKNGLLPIFHSDFHPDKGGWHKKNRAKARHRSLLVLH